MEEDEVNKEVSEGKVSCVECKTWWNLACAELHQGSSTWLCYGCLLDTAKTSVNHESSDEDDSDLDVIASTSPDTFQVIQMVECVEYVCFLAFLLVVSIFAPIVVLLFMLGAVTMKIYQVLQIWYATFVAVFDLNSH